MKYKNRKIIVKFKKYTLETILMIIGSLIMALGITYFLLPNQLSSGGFSGIATITYYLFNLPMGLTIIILNIPLFLIAFFKIGKAFFTKAIIGTIALSIFLDLLENVKPLTQDRFLACIYGGIIIGLGTALVLKASGSTGGTELLSNIIRTYKKNFRTSTLIVLLDTIIISLNVIFFKQVEIGLYSAIVIYIMGKIVDIIFEGIYFTKMMFIVSSKYQEISNQIGTKLNRGTTGIYSKGMYTNEERLMLLCIASRNEVIQIKQIARKIDPKSFIIIANAREVLGKGFKKE